MSKPRKKTKPTKVYPTNERYNKRVPVTGFRIDSETVKKLYELFEASNAGTWGIFFKRLLGYYKLELISIGESRKAGYEAGYRDAKSRFAVPFPCAECGQTIYIEGAEQKAKVMKLIGDRWAHTQCPKPNFEQQTPLRPIPPQMSRPKPNPPAVPIAKLNGSQDAIQRFIQREQTAEQHLTQT